MNYKKPQLCGESGNMYFEFGDGKKSKNFHSSKQIDHRTGSYEVLNLSGEVEYMDLFGNFSKSPTEFASKLYDYINFERFNNLVYRSRSYTLYQTALTAFPSKFLINEKVLDFITKYEQQRFKKLCNNGSFVSLLEKMSYKRFVMKTYKAKIRRMKKLSQNDEIIKEVYEQTSNFQ